MAVHKTEASSNHAALYRTIWRWHFYAGIFCIPFILAMSISGAIYLFKPQIDNWQDIPYKNLALNGERKSANQHIAAALEAVPNGKFKSYELASQGNAAVVINVASEPYRQRVYVDPVDLSILAVRDHHNEFLQQVKHFHGELFLGNAGSVLVELAACWAMVLIISGLYLWWPCSAHGLGGVVYPRLRQGSRRFWRDLHAVTGFWVAFFALFLLISGLPWTLVWGSAFTELRQIGEQTTVQGEPHKMFGMGDGSGQGSRLQAQPDWRISSEHNQHQGTSRATRQYNLTAELLVAAQGLDFALPAELSVSNAAENIWQLSSQSQNRPLRTDAWINASDGQVLKIRRFADKSFVDRVIAYGIAIHEGQLFGWLNQLLGAFTAAALVILSVSGFVLWRKRKPEDALGAPTAKYSPHATHVVLGIVLVAALLLPVLLISLILIIVIERYVLHYFPALRHWLGLADIRSS